ncbi:50S ribosomal protein L24 [Candidatus Fermentibacteria bacterium]|nr:50S ribosomal protein L24 [Candidatus Fermentibacteria bacterium]
MKKRNEGLGLAPKGGATTRRGTSSPLIRKGDTVQVISGDDKGKRGKVLRVIPAKQRVVVEKVNFMKRHTRPSQKNQQGGIIEKEAPVHISNVALVVDDRRERVGRKHLADGRRVRFVKRSGEMLSQ